MSTIWGDLFDPKWFERFKKVWGELEISEEDLKKTMKMWEYNDTGVNFGIK